MHFLNFSGNVSLRGNRHCPSPAIFAPSNEPSPASITVLYGTLNRTTGTIIYKITNTAKLVTILCLRMIFKRFFPVDCFINKLIISSCFNWRISKIQIHVCTHELHPASDGGYSRFKCLPSPIELPPALAGG